MNAAQITKPNAQIRFWDRIAERYARKPVPDQEVYETKLIKTEELLKPTDRVLEVGCGTGTTALHHAPRVASYRATDLSPRMIEIARAKAEDEGLDNLTFDVAGVEDLTSEPEPYDVVLAHSVLHLVAEVPAALARFHELLRPGGRLVLTVPCLGDTAAWFRYVGPLGTALGLFPKVYVFREMQFMSWLEGAGFEVEERWLPGPRRGVFLIARKLG